MEKKETQKGIISEAIETLDALSKLMDERVVDLHEVKGGMQARHAYCFYRQHVWKIKSLIQKLEK